MGMAMLAGNASVADGSISVSFEFVVKVNVSVGRGGEGKHRYSVLAGIVVKEQINTHLIRALVDEIVTSADEESRGQCTARFLAGGH